MNDAIQHTAILLLGGNVGDRLSFIKKAIVQIMEQCGVVAAQSKIYETASWGIETLPAHLNVALQIKTTLQPEELLHSLQKIENNLERQRSKKWGERTIDIDILYFDDSILNTDTLVIPHPLIQVRRFALVPLCDFANDYVHPVFDKTNKTLLDECEDKLSVSEYKEQL